MDIREKALKIYREKKQRITDKKFKNKYPEEYKFLMKYTATLSENCTISQRLYHIVNEIINIPNCPECGKDLKFYKFTSGYSKFCSNICMRSSPILLEQRRQTCLEKYGVDHPFKSDEVKRKRRETCLEKYGVDHNSKAPEVRDKIKQTCLEKYGVDHNFKSEDSKNKRKNTWIERYGVDQYWKSDKSIEDWKKHNLKHRKEVIWPRLIKSLKEKNFILLTTPEEFTGDIEFLCDSGHKNSTCIGNWFRDLKCGKCSGNGMSKMEQDIFDYISSFVEAENGTKKIISPKQLDIYIKEHNLAIEFNGIYYHSESTGTPRDYHINKTLACRDMEIDLIHIFEDEWLYKQDIVKSMLLNKLGKIENRVYARKCKVKKIETKIKDLFLEHNHIQGTCVSSINLGLFHEEELISVMTFGKRKITGQVAKNELLRFCNKLNTSAVGGVSKLFKYYVDTYKPNNIISYADKRWFSGKMYEDLGFELDHESGPNYWYIINGLREHRAKYQKHKLPKLLEKFDSTKTEWQNMQDNGYDRIWDCGMLVYRRENK